MSFSELFLLNAKDYLGTVTNVYINIILLFIAAALCIACFFINYHKTYTVLIIKQLLRRGAVSEDKAITLTDMRLGNTIGLKAALSRDGQLTRIVKRVGFSKPTYEQYKEDEEKRKAHLKDKSISKEEKKAAKRLWKKESRAKIDFATAKFFIPEESVKRAELIKEKENPTLLRTVLVCVLILSLYVCVMLLMPSILRLISNIEI
ncbi:MAG: hypothetical protein IKV16_05110 [Clostridia bacterium]|nr:hypothetical protein [Clostridia bacterium]